MAASEDEIEDSETEIIESSTSGEQLNENEEVDTLPVQSALADENTLPLENTLVLEDKEILDDMTRLQVPLPVETQLLNEADNKDDERNGEEKEVFGKNEGPSGGRSSPPKAEEPVYTSLVDSDASTEDEDEKQSGEAEGHDVKHSNCHSQAIKDHKEIKQGSSTGPFRKDSSMAQLSRGTYSSNSQQGPEECLYSVTKGENNETKPGHPLGPKVLETPESSKGISEHKGEKFVSSASTNRASIADSDGSPAPRCKRRSVASVRTASLRASRLRSSLMSSASKGQHLSGEVEDTSVGKQTLCPSLNVSQSSSLVAEDRSADLSEHISNNVLYTSKYNPFSKKRSLEVCLNKATKCKESVSLHDGKEIRSERPAQNRTENLTPRKLFPDADLDKLVGPLSEKHITDDNIEHRTDVDAIKLDDKKDELNTLPESSVIYEADHLKPAATHSTVNWNESPKHSFVPAGLSYLDSQEPGEESKANALNTVDKLVWINTTGFSQDLEKERLFEADPSRNPRAKGQKNLAHLVEAKSPKERLGVFDWVDSQHDKARGHYLGSRAVALASKSVGRRSYKRDASLKQTKNDKKAGEKRRNTVQELKLAESNLSEHKCDDCDKVQNIGEKSSLSDYVQPSNSNGTSGKVQSKYGVEFMRNQNDSDMGTKHGHEALNTKKCWNSEGIGPDTQLAAETLQIMPSENCNLATKENDFNRTIQDNDKYAGIKRRRRSLRAKTSDEPANVKSDAKSKKMGINLASDSKKTVRQAKKEEQVKNQPGRGEDELDILVMDHGKQVASKVPEAERGNENMAEMAANAASKRNRKQSNLKVMPAVPENRSSTKSTTRSGRTIRQSERMSSGMKNMVTKRHITRKEHLKQTDTQLVQGSIGITNPNQMAECQEISIHETRDTRKKHKKNSVEGMQYMQTNQSDASTKFPFVEEREPIASNPKEESFHRSSRKRRDLPDNQIGNMNTGKETNDSDKVTYSMPSKSKRRKASEIKTTPVSSEAISHKGDVNEKQNASLRDRGQRVTRQSIHRSKDGGFDRDNVETSKSVAEKSSEHNNIGRRTRKSYILDMENPDYDRKVSNTAKTPKQAIATSADRNAGGMSETPKQASIVYVGPKPKKLSGGTFNKKQSQRSTHKKELIALDMSPAFQCVSSRKRREPGNICVLFSHGLNGDLVKHQKKILKRLGGRIATAPSDCTHFVTDKFVRTKNMLEAMASGKHVVTPLWLENCGQASYFIDEKKFILEDMKKEKEIGFNMSASLASARQRPLLQDQKVYVTPSTNPDRDSIISLVKAANGQVLDNLKGTLSKTEDLENLIVISCEEDEGVCIPLLERGAKIHSPEFLFNSIVTQNLDLSREKLFTDHVKGMRSLRHRT